MNEEKSSVQKMAEIMALLFYHISKEVIDTFGDEGERVLRKAIENFGSERGENIRKEVLSRGLPQQWKIFQNTMICHLKKPGKAPQK